MNPVNGPSRKSSGTSSTWNGSSPTGAFRFSRLDDTQLSGVEENDYIDNVKGIDLNLSDLQEEYLVVRNSTIWVFRNITDEMMDFKGLANQENYTARTLGFGTIGHNIHHCRFIRKMYLGV